jgi:hypothetical protein
VEDREDRMRDAMTGAFQSLLRRFDLAARALSPGELRNRP